MEDVRTTSFVEDEDVGIQQQLHTRQESDENVDSLDDARMTGNTNSNVSDRVLRRSVKLGNTHAFVPRASAMKHVRYEKYYKNELSTMNKELKLEEKEMTRHMSIDMISAYRMSVRQAEGDKD